MKHYGDITKLNGYELPVVDVITGGSPCQDLSVAGKRAGLAGERSGLFLEQIRIIKEMREHDRNTGRSGIYVRPRYMVWENVPGAFSSGTPKGADFQVVLTEIARIAKADAPDVPLPDKWGKSGCLMGIGTDGCPFSIAWRLHDAQFWGVAQRRKRIALVADFGGGSAPEILFEREGLHGDSDQSGEARKETAGGFGPGAEGSSRIEEFIKAANIGAPHQQDLIQSAHGSGVNKDVSFTINGVDRHAAAMVDKSPMIQAAGESGNNKPVVCTMAKPVVGCNIGGQAETFSQSESMYTLRAETIGAVMPVAAYEFDRASYNQGANGKFGISIDEERIGAQTSRGPGAVYPQGGVVRRLTPVECERLQGFPDGWTDIGEWTDTKGKRHKESSDAARYKALGNSIAVGYANRASGLWCWLLKRISAQYERDATLGSLFDGIGGFPLAWEHYNGKGSAIWASEIEEFCIAVTKIRFPEAEDETVHPV